MADQSTYTAVNLPVDGNFAFSADVTTDLIGLIDEFNKSIGTSKLSDGGVTRAKIAQEGWTSYTPVWTTSGTAPSLGNGTITGSYSLSGKNLIWKMNFSPGTTTTYGTGTWLFSVPAAISGGIVGGYDITQDAGAATYGGPVHLTTSTTVQLWSSSGSFITVTNTAPFTWAGGNDSLNIFGMAEAL